MPCTDLGGGVSICRSPRVRAAKHCDTCGRVRPMSGVFGLWYGWTLTCLACGDTYNSEYAGREPRPFTRGWKEKAIREARQDWVGAMPLRLEIDRQIAEEEQHREANPHG